MKTERDTNRKGERRSYPPFWERAVPVFVALIGLIIIGLIIVALLVVLGVFPA